MEAEGGAFVSPVDMNDDSIDSAWVMPERNIDTLPSEVIETIAGRYIRVEFPDSQAHLDDDDVLQDEDGNCYVPINQK